MWTKWISTKLILHSPFLILNSLYTMSPSIANISMLKGGWLRGGFVFGHITPLIYIDKVIKVDITYSEPLNNSIVKLWPGTWNYSLVLASVICDHWPETMEPGLDDETIMLILSSVSPHQSSIIVSMKQLQRNSHPESHSQTMFRDKIIFSQNKSLECW